MSGRGRGGRGRGGGLKAPPGRGTAGRGGGMKAPPKAATKKAPKEQKVKAKAKPKPQGRGRGGGVAVPPGGGGGQPKGPAGGATSPRKKGLFGKKGSKRGGGGGRGRGTGVKIPPGAKSGPPTNTPPPADVETPAQEEPAVPKSPRAFVATEKKVVEAGNKTKQRMPKSKKLVIPQSKNFATDGSRDLKAMGSMSQVGAKATKVKRQHKPRFAKNKWFGIQNTFYEYDKIKDALVCEGAFTRMKPKVWGVIYYDMILFYAPGDDGMPDSEDKYNGCPIDYFFLDNIIDSAKIKGDPGSMTITCPTKVSKDNLKLKCDSKDQFQTWFETIKALAEVFETTDREGMSSRQETDELVKKAQDAIPLTFDPMGHSAPVPAEKAGQWLELMHTHFQEHRKHVGFLRKIERFSEFRVGPIAVYCNFYFARDRDGPVEILEKTKKTVFAAWEAEIQRILDLGEEVLAEGSVDKDHVPFHMEDCQIAAFLIDCMNNYSQVVHGVASKKVRLAEKVAELDDLYGRFSVAPLMVEEAVDKA